jgi:hypothetical protein
MAEGTMFLKTASIFGNAAVALTVGFILNFNLAGSLVFCI